MSQTRAKQSKLDFKGKSEQGAYRTEISSQDFASRLYRSGVLAKDQEGRSYLKRRSQIAIDFRGAGYLNLWDFATLAVLIRKLAIAGTQVEITWPGSFRGDLSGFQQLLDGLRFSDLFSAEVQGDQPWLKNVKITKLPKAGAQLTLAGQSRFVPLSWLDKHSYEFTGEDLWRVTPKLSSHLEERVRKLFLKEGFDDLETIDEINSTFLYELGWNIVLHSERLCGDGFGVFCAQLSYPSRGSSIARPSIALCVCDCGIGIPRALSTSFASAVKDGSFNQHLTATQASQIVRYSFDPQSTSRPVHASEVDKTGTRGLAHVAAGIQHVGSTVLRSDGGCVNLGGTESAQLDYNYDDTLAQTPLLGTQAIVFLRKPRMKLRSDVKLVPPIPREFDILHAVHADGTSAVTSSSEAKELIARVPVGAAGILFDIGFADKNSRQVEYLLTHARQTFPTRDLVFWNVKHLPQLEPFLQNLARSLSHGAGSLAFSGLDQTAIVVGPETKLSPFRIGKIASHYAEVQQLGVSLIRGNWDVTELERVNNSVNTHLLETIARDRRNENGIFTGKIHLPGGKLVPRYFSLLDNTKSQLGGSMTRWAEGCSVAASLFVEESQCRNAKWTILSFTGTTRDLCWQMHRKLGLASSCAHVLMTFELPTKRDIASLVRSGDNVLLLTDAISTGTLVSEVIKLVKDVGGLIRGVITCVDSRIHPPANKARFIHNSTEAPLRSCAELFSGWVAWPEEPKDDVELWVDPVSLVPQQRNTWEMPAKLLDDVNRSIEFIVQSDAAVCGHLVEGTRHSSVYVRVGKIAREAQQTLEKQVHAKIAQRLVRPDNSSNMRRT